MDRTMALNMSKEMIRKDLESPLTFEYFKEIVDNTKITSSTEDQEVYTKSTLICFLFDSLSYCEIEDYIMLFGSNVKRMCASIDWYNGVARMIQASVYDLLVEISRRIETEVLLHLYDMLEIFLKYPELFSEKVTKYIDKNICDVNKLATLDVAEEYQYEQLGITGIVQKKERANEKFSKANYYRKDNIRKSIKKYILKNYNEESFGDFVKALDNVIDNLDISKEKIYQLKEKYKEVIESLYVYVSPIWLDNQNKKDVNQLTLYDYIR